MRHRWVALSLLTAVACVDPSDVLFSRALVPPVEISPGLFQVTFDPNPDYVRGFTPTGDTIVYRSMRSTAEFDSTWEMLQYSALGSYGASEGAGLYRIPVSVFGLPVSNLITRINDRLLIRWELSHVGEVFGPAGCPHERQLAMWRLQVWGLPLKDGTPLSDIPLRILPTNVSDGVIGAQNPMVFHVRFNPGEQVADSGGDPFGPSAGQSSADAYYSDGDAIWHFSLSDPAGPRDSVGAGIFPRVSRDGSLLAVAIPSGLDSTLVVENYRALCFQFEERITASSWTTAVLKLPSRDTLFTVAGTEPTFNDSAHTLIVRRRGGLVSVDLATRAEAPMVNTEGAFAPAVSRDGKYLAFSKTVSNNTDVYFVKLN